MFGALCWIVFVNLTVALCVALYHWRATAKGVVGAMGQLPVVGLCKWLWDLLPKRQPKRTAEEKIEELTAAVMALSDRVQRPNPSNGHQQQTTPKRKCWWCGSETHIQRNCPKRPQTPKTPCALCGGRHWKYQCPEKHTNVTDSREQPVDNARRRLYYVQGTIKAESRQNNVKFLIDTGSTVNLLPRALVEELGLTVSETTTPEVRSFAGESHPVLGEVALPTRLGDCDENLRFLVVETAPKAILGLPALQACGLRINCKEDSLETATGTKLLCHQVSGFPAADSKNC